MKIGKEIPSKENLIYNPVNFEEKYSLFLDDISYKVFDSTSLKNYHNSPLFDNFSIDESDYFLINGGFTCGVSGFTFIPQLDGSFEIGSKSEIANFGRHCLRCIKKKHVCSMWKLKFKDYGPLKSDVVNIIISKINENPDSYLIETELYKFTQNISSKINSGGKRLLEPLLLTTLFLSGQLAASLAVIAGIFISKDKKNKADDNNKTSISEENKENKIIVKEVDVLLFLQIENFYRNFQNSVAKIFKFSQENGKIVEEDFLSIVKRESSKNFDMSKDNKTLTEAMVIIEAPEGNRTSNNSIEQNRPFRPTFQDINPNDLPLTAIDIVRENNINDDNFRPPNIRRAIATVMTNYNFFNVGSMQEVRISRNQLNLIFSLMPEIGSRENYFRGLVNLAERFVEYRDGAHIFRTTQNEQLMTLGEIFFTIAENENMPNFDPIVFLTLLNTLSEFNQRDSRSDDGASINLFLQILSPYLNQIVMHPYLHRRHSTLYLLTLVKILAEVYAAWGVRDEPNNETRESIITAFNELFVNNIILRDAQQAILPVINNGFRAQRNYNTFFNENGFNRNNLYQWYNQIAFQASNNNITSLIFRNRMFREYLNFRYPNIRREFFDLDYNPMIDVNRNIDDSDAIINHMLYTPRLNESDSNLYLEAWHKIKDNLDSLEKKEENKEEEKKNDDGNEESQRLIIPNPDQNFSDGFQIFRNLISNRIPIRYRDILSAQGERSFGDALIEFSRSLPEHQRQHIRFNTNASEEVLRNFDSISRRDGQLLANMQLLRSRLNDVLGSYFNRMIERIERSPNLNAGLQITRYLINFIVKIRDDPELRARIYKALKTLLVSLGFIFLGEFLIGIITKTGEKLEQSIENVIDKLTESDPKAEIIVEDTREDKKTPPQSVDVFQKYEFIDSLNKRDFL